MPLLAFLAAEAVLALAAALCWQDPRRPATFVRWDSVRYLSIATHGYFVEEADGRVVDGNVAWFPGYPVAIRALGRWGVRAPRAGRFLSAAAGFALLLVLWNATFPWADADKGPILLLLAAFFPGFVYCHAVFPISMTATFVLLAIVCAARGRFVVGGLFGALAAFTYSAGVAIVAVLALAALVVPGLGGRRRFVALLQGAGLTAVGFLGALAYQHRTVAWNSFSRMQHDYYGAGLHEPLTSIAWKTRHVWTREFQPELLIHAQTALVALVVLACVLAFWRRGGGRGEPLDVLLLASGLLFWLLPHVVSPHVSVYRSEALLVAFVPVMRRLPRDLLLLLLVVFVALGFGMGILFFESILV